MSNEMPGKMHHRSCPRLQFWDAGEWQAPCRCPSVGSAAGNATTTTGARFLRKPMPDYPDPPRTSAPATEDCAECASGSCCHGHLCDGPKGCVCPTRPAPQTPMQEQPRAEGPYVTGLPPATWPTARCDFTENGVQCMYDSGHQGDHVAQSWTPAPDQMTALERQLTAQIVLWRQAGEAWAARADELAAQSAVVEAARDVVADIENDGSMRSSTLAKLLAALDALDDSHAAPDEAHSRL